MVVTESGPLDGIRVVEAASYMSGPFATLMLADLGADVVKVEPPKGDPFRRFGRPATAMSSVFANSNRGKRSVVLDLKVADDVAKMRELLAVSDVFLSNWRPQVAARLGLGDEALAGANPRLIRLYISGFGPSGPSVDEPAYDGVIQARSSQMYAQSARSEPLMSPGYPVDKTVALMAAQAVLAALFARERCGHGARVDLPMLDVASYVNYPDLLAGRTFIDQQPAEARNLVALAPRPLPACDGWILVSPVSGAEVRRACAAVDHPEWADELLAERHQLTMLRGVQDRLETATRTETMAALVERFGRHDVPAAPCLTIDQHLADPQVVHNAVYSIDDWPEVGPTRSVRYPARFDAETLGAARRYAPLLGADTADVIAELDESKTTVEAAEFPIDTED